MSRSINPPPRPHSYRTAQRSTSSLASRSAPTAEMPSATRAEALIGIPEVKDGPLPSADANTGTAILARTTQIANYPPLGVADMLYVRKRYVPVVGAPKIYGYYHFVRAVEVSSVAAVSAYIVDVVRNTGLESPSWAPGWEFASSTFGAFEIASATFAAYNFFSNADVFVHVDFPGSTTATATDERGFNVPLDDAFWKELLVSSYVRHIDSHGEQPLYPCLRVLSYSPRAEATFLNAAASCVHRWHLSGTEASTGPTKDAAKSRVAKSIRDYFLGSLRYDAAIEFFSRKDMRETDPSLFMYAAAAARLKGRLDLASTMVDEFLNVQSESDLGWMERARIFRARGAIQDALDAVSVASRHSEGGIDLSVLVADLNADALQYEKSFEALNRGDMPPPSLDPFLRKLVPNWKNVTSPIEGASLGTDAVRILAKRVREERNFMNDRTDGTLSDLPARMLTGAEHECYAVLVKILKDLSWDDMLAVRGECFVMEADLKDRELDSSLEDGEDGGGDKGEGGEESEGEEENEFQSNQEGKKDTKNDSLEQEPTMGTEADPSNETDMITTISLNDEASENSMTHSANGDATGDVKQRALDKIGKQVCKPWLDYLVLNMYNDLKAMALWNAEEQQFSTAAALAATALAGRTRRDGVAGEDESNSESEDIEAADRQLPLMRSADEILKTTRRPPSDWLRRGELALRLGRREDAKTAFLVCTKLAAKEKTTAVTAHIRLLKIAADDGDPKPTLKYADAVWSYMDASTDRKQSSDPSPSVPPVRKALFEIITKKGLRSVRETVHQIDIGRKRMESLLLDAVALGVEGFSR